MFECLSASHDLSVQYSSSAEFYDAAYHIQPEFLYTYITFTPKHKRQYETFWLSSYYVRC